MAEYIDREKLLRDIEKYHLSDGKLQHWVEIQPAADVEHVIRCKDCKHWGDNGGIYTAADGVRFARCRIHNNEHLSGLHEGWCPTENCYCSLGERKEKTMAIKIIKPGKKPDTTERFTCRHCGCVFEADEDDYEYEFDSLNGCYCYAADCPTCGLTARKPDDE